MNWEEVLQPIKESNSFKELWDKVEKEYREKECFPPKNQIFRALELTPFSEVKVVILGQDPYHNDGQANGLCFSVSEQVPAPPSLKNIFKELKEDLGIDRIKNDLEDWAHQGVLLLNATLTVVAHQANSHKSLGWEFFTDEIIKQLSDKRENLIFVLWGVFAQKKIKLIDSTKHLVIKNVHPSPLSVYRGFYGSKPFSQINHYLEEKKLTPIHWEG